MMLIDGDRKIDVVKFCSSYYTVHDRRLLVRQVANLKTNLFTMPYQKSKSKVPVRNRGRFDTRQGTIGEARSLGNLKLACISLALTTLVSSGITIGCPAYQPLIYLAIVR